MQQREGWPYGERRKQDRARRVLLTDRARAVMAGLPAQIRAELEEHLEEHLQGLAQLPPARALCLVGQQHETGFCCEVAGYFVWHRIHPDMRRTLVTQVVAGPGASGSSAQGSECA